MRTTDQIHEDITEVTTSVTPEKFAELGRLWREMARASDREKQPGWATLAAALLADDYDRHARTAGVAPHLPPGSEPITTEAANARLRTALREQARARTTVPPRLTTQVATSTFERLLAAHPGATPEVIAVALIRQADQWDEVDAVHTALRRFTQPDQPARADQP